MLISLRTFFWNTDPGYFQLKQGLKTVLAILISLWLLQNETLITKFMAAVASGFSMQGVIARTMISRIKHVIFFIFMYFTAFCLGLLVRDSPLGTAITLVIMGFLVNYIRRFGLEKSIAPVMAWLLCFLATILPFNHTAEAWAHIHGLGVGLLVSALVTIFIFPENYARLFMENTHRFFVELGRGVEAGRRYVLLIHKVDKSQFLNESVKIKKSLRELININQFMQHSQAFAGFEKRINKILLHQYALFNAYTMMIDAYRCLEQYNLSKQNCLQLGRLAAKFAEFFTMLDIKSDYVIKSVSPTPKNLAGLDIENISEVSQIMMLLNLKLSFDIFSQQAGSLLENDPI